MTDAVSKIAGRWIDFRSKRIISRILNLENEKTNKVKVRHKSCTGHERKLILEVEEERYVMRISLSKNFTWESKVHEVCRREGAPVAPVAECGVQWRGLIPVNYLVLEYLPGNNCDEDSEISLSQISKTGKAFGQIHSIGEEFFDDSKRRSKISSANSVKKLFKKYLKHSKRKIGLDKKKLRRVSEWLREGAKIVDEKNFIRLTHGDPHGNNIIKNGEEIFLIDTDSMALGFAPFEFVQCLLASYNNLDLEKQIAFMQGYRKEADRVLLDVWEKNKKFISAAVLLKMTWERLKFAESTHSKRRFKRAVSFWRSFLEISSREICIRSIDDINSIVKNKINNNEKV